MLRRRYLLLLAWAIGWFAVRFGTEQRGLNDWNWFEFGARTLIHLNSHYASGSLHLYANYPVLQVGPPPLLMVASLQWLAPTVVAWIFGIVMAGLGVWCVKSAESIANRLVPARAERTPATALLAGLIGTACWSWQAARWQHLDDALVVSALLAATALVVRRDRWWLASILVGLAIATKPWALVMAPVLLALPREQWSRAALAGMAAAALPWLPFIVADHGTVSALAGFHPTIDRRSALHTLGVPFGVAPGWARSVQLLLGCAFTTAVVIRGRWQAIPVVALGIRVVTDPQAWSYYGIAPLMGAVVLDMCAPRRAPIWTASTAMVEFAAAKWVPGSQGALQLAWLVVVMVAGLRRTSPESSDALCDVGLAAVNAEAASSSREVMVAQ